MKVLNVHQRQLDASPEEVGALIDSLASDQDRLWPYDQWPRMRFDRPLAVGAKGGHGPIRYFVEEYLPGQEIRFRFTGPAGFDGVHAYEVLPGAAGSVVLRHRISMQTRGLAVVSWPLLYRPLHDALMEDSLTKAERSLGLPGGRLRWSPWVRILRWALTRPAGL